MDERTVADIMEMNFENEKAVVFGNRLSIITAYVFTLIACFFTFALGAMMIYVSGPSLHLSRKFKEEGITSLTKKDLWCTSPAGEKSNEKVFGIFAIAGMVNTFLIMLIAAFRILILKQTLKKEAKLLMSLKSVD